MRYAIACCFGLLPTLLLSAGCSAGHQPMAPSTVDATPPAASAETTCAFATPSQSAQVYMFAEPAGAPVAAYTRCSRFVLYDNGVFDLQYGHGPSYEGTYGVRDAVVDFKWDGWSIAGPWGSTATLVGDTLTVHYNSLMQLTDFEDAVYRRSN
jgi:hypothetical protein